MKRKIILNLAMSLDGYIADLEGGFEWIKGDGSNLLDTLKQFKFEAFLDTVDTIVMGRKAFEVCDPEIFSKQKIIVATSGTRPDLQNVCFISEDPVKHVEMMRQNEGKAIWIFGGGILADAFIKSNLIDTYIVGIIPIILGRGIPLFLGEHMPMPLTLKGYTVQEGIVILE